MLPTLTLVITISCSIAMDWFCLLLNLTWNCVVCPILPLALSSNIMCSGCIHNVTGSKHPLLLVLHVVFRCGIQYGTQYLADMNILVHVFWFDICADFSWLSDLNGLFRSQGGLFCLVIINITRDFQSSTIHYHPLSVYELHQFSSVQFSRLVMSDSLRPHELQHPRPPFPSPTPRGYSNSCPLSW